MRYLTNKEIANVMGVSESTIVRIQHGQFGGKEKQPLLRVKTIRVGGGLRWDAASFGKVIGKTEEELEDLLA